MGAFEMYGSPIDKKKWKKYAIGTVVANEVNNLTGGGYWQHINITGLKFKPTRAILWYYGATMTVMDLERAKSIAANYPHNYFLKNCQYVSNPIGQYPNLYGTDYFGDDSVYACPIKYASVLGNLTFNYIVFGE